MAELRVTIEIDDERILEILEEQDVKRPSQAKVNKLKKLFEDVESDFFAEFEEVLENALKEIIEEEWGE